MSSDTHDDVKLCNRPRAMTSESVLRLTLIHFSLHDVDDDDEDDEDREEDRQDDDRLD